MCDEQRIACAPKTTRRALQHCSTRLYSIGHLVFSREQERVNPIHQDLLRMHDQLHVRLPLLYSIRGWATPPQALRQISRVGWIQSGNGTTAYPMPPQGGIRVFKLDGVG